MSCKPRLAVPRIREQEGRRMSWQVEPGGVGGAGGREWTSWRDQNLEDPVKFFGGVIISYPVNFEELGSETPLFSFSVHFHFLKL